MAQLPVGPALLLITGAALVGAILGAALVPVARWQARSEDGLRFRMRPIAAAAGAVLFALVVWRFGLKPETVAYILLAAAAVVLTVVDIAEKRLPDAVILPSTVVFAAALAGCAALRGNWGPYLAALAGAVGMFVVYLVLAILPRAQMGFGDVKLSFVLGMAAGYLGVRAWLIALVSAFLLNAVASIVALALRRVTLRSFVPFGPAMIAGAFVAVAFG